MTQIRTLQQGSQLQRAAWIALVGLGLMLFVASPAAAHTGFESSDPTDGSTLETEVHRIVLTFTGEATPTGEGFVVFDPSGELRSPETATSDEANQIWTLTFDPPLAGGTVGVRWTVQAPDAHPIDGSFSFTAPAAASNDEPNTEATDQSEGGEPDSEPKPEGLVLKSVTTDDAALEDFLTPAENGVPYAEGVGAFGRLLGFLGTMLGIGGLAFVSVVVRGHPRDVRTVLKGVRYAAIAVVAGTAVDLIAHLAVASNGWGAIGEPIGSESVLASPYGMAIALRTAAGTLLFVVARNAPRTPRVRPSVEADQRELVHAGPGGMPLAADPQVLGELWFDDHRSIPFGSSPDGVRTVEERSVSLAGLISVVLLLVSFTFDGHTITEGNRWITGAVDMTHVVSASIWAGGVVAFSAVLWQRHRRNERLNGLEMALRFSTIAGAALALAGIAGTILTTIILDSVSELWTTPWGRVLIAKTTAVAAAALLGTYNHFIVIPWMKTHPNDDIRSVKLRNTVTGEAILLTMVIVATALLVGASSQT